MIPPALPSLLSVVHFSPVFILLVPLPPVLSSQFSLSSFLPLLPPSLRSALHPLPLPHLSNPLFSPSSSQVTPEDIVRLYESITSSLTEMSQLDGYKEDEALMGQLFARLTAARAQRCFWVAESYGAVSKWREAGALYDRTMELMLEAVELFKSSGELTLVGRCRVLSLPCVRVRIWGWGWGCDARK